MAPSDAATITVNGRILDYLDREPQADVKVWLINGADRYSITTDSGGRFSITAPYQPSSRLEFGGGEFLVPSIQIPSSAAQAGIWNVGDLLAVPNMVEPETGIPLLQLLNAGLALTWSGATRRWSDEHLPLALTLTATPDTPTPVVSLAQFVLKRTINFWNEGIERDVFKPGTSQNAERVAVLLTTVNAEGDPLPTGISTVTGWLDAFKPARAEVRVNPRLLPHLLERVLEHELGHALLLRDLDIIRSPMSTLSLGEDLSHLTVEECLLQAEHIRSANQQLCLQLLNNAYRRAIVDHDLNSMIRALLNAAIVYRARGDADLAKEVLEVSASIAPNPILAAAAESTLGLTALDAGHAELAVDHFKLARQKAQQAGNWHGVIANLTNLAKSHMNLGHLDHAEALLERALRLFEHYRDSGATGCGTILANFGELYYRRGNVDEARHYLESSVLISRRENRLRFAASSLVTLADLAREESDVDKELEYLEAAAQLFDTCGDRILAVRYVERAMLVARAVRKVAQTDALLEWLGNLLKDASLEAQLHHLVLRLDWLEEQQRSEEARELTKKIERYERALSKSTRQNIRNRLSRRKSDLVDLRNDLSHCSG